MYQGKDDRTTIQEDVRRGLNKPDRKWAMLIDLRRIVMVNYEECIGCGRWVTACPYKPRNLDGGGFYTDGTSRIEAYETSSVWEYGRKWLRKRHHIPIGNARECYFCTHRIRIGMPAVCINTCIARANYYGDHSDPESLIYKMIKSNRISVLTSFKGNGSNKISFPESKGMAFEEIAGCIGTPGKIPVFAEKAVTRPRFSTYSLKEQRSCKTQWKRPDFREGIS